MSAVDQARAELARSLNTLIERRGITSNTEEIAAIDEAIEKINDNMDVLDQAALLDAARQVAEASDALEAVVANVRMGPFDGLLTKLESHVSVLSSAMGDLIVPNRPVFAAAPSNAAPIQPAATPAAPEVAPMAEPEPADIATDPANVAGLPPISKNRDFAQLKAEYHAYYNACTARPEHQGGVDFYLSRLRKGKDIYQGVGAALGNIPWSFIGIIHGLESGFDFSCHLHNGDPLSDRTVQVPAGRPRTGSPPFTWRQSAMDALTMKGFHENDDWSAPRMLFLFERYNGLGYRFRGLPSPYLWSFSNHYEKGKFVADGVFDPDAVSKQCGAAVMLKAVQDE